MGDRYSEDPDLITPLVISHLVPVVGGLYEYVKYRDSRPQISEIFKFVGLAVPSMVAVNQILSLVNISNGWISLVVLFAIAFIIKKVFLQDNRYADIIWISYGGLVGLIYSYYFKYSDDEGIRYLIYHFVFRTLAYAIMIGLVLGLVSIAVLAILLNMGIDLGVIPGL